MVLKDVVGLHANDRTTEITIDKLMIEWEKREHHDQGETGYVEKIKRYDRYTA